TDNLKAALDIYIRLRTRAAGGKPNTPCHDKEIELALGRHLEAMGRADTLKAALDIFTRLRTRAAGWARLRTRAAGGRVNTPCDDKDIELTLGRYLQTIGGKGSLEVALEIFTRLRTRAAGGRVNTPCDDKDIELTLGRYFQIMGDATNL
ncbi:hypothetical protein, partial [Sansalvadorimonas verongulae]|uniref:hypothetical protein n=1 Tax=Sansalvadorimonas verongulae TaxID=2172824 RepID=UPI0018AD284B